MYIGCEKACSYAIHTYHIGDYRSIVSFLIDGGYNMCLTFRLRGRRAAAFTCPEHTQGKVTLLPRGLSWRALPASPPSIPARLASGFSAPSHVLRSVFCLCARFGRGRPEGRVSPASSGQHPSSADRAMCPVSPSLSLSQDRNIVPRDVKQSHDVQGFH